jgi:HD-GYP domain-containing protein (c-di-GMP phosphodiesterase class II)
MRTCARCGLSIGDAATFCMVCGTRVERSPSATSATLASSAPQSGWSRNERAVARDGPAAAGPDGAPSRRLREAALPMHAAGELETTDPARAVALYRESILRCLEAADDPLDDEGARHDLLVSFDRLSLVLKREGQPEEALEEIDSAASLGLLDCQDQGIKGHREALRKRQESLRRALDPGASTD